MFLSRAVGTTSEFENQRQTLYFFFPGHKYLLEILFHWDGLVGWLRGQWFSYSFSFLESPGGKGRKMINFLMSWLLCTFWRQKKNVLSSFCPAELLDAGSSPLSCLSWLPASLCLQFRALLCSGPCLLPTWSSRPVRGGLLSGPLGRHPPGVSVLLPSESFSDAPDERWSKKPEQQVQGRRKDNSQQWNWQ